MDCLMMTSLRSIIDDDGLRSTLYGGMTGNIEFDPDGRLAFSGHLPTTILSYASMLRLLNAPNGNLPRSCSLAAFENE